jgi:hypothetical protein
MDEKLSVPEAAGEALALIRELPGEREPSAGRECAGDRVPLPVPAHPVAEGGSFWPDLYRNLFQPGSFFEARRLGAHRLPYGYLFAVIFVSLAVARLWSRGFALWRNEAALPAFGRSSTLAVIIGEPFAVALLSAAAVALFVPALERSLRLLGAARERSAGRVIARSGSALLAAMIPGIGIPLALTWGLVLLGTGFRTVYGVGPLRLLLAAALAVTGLAVLLVLPFLLLAGAALALVLLLPALVAVL